MEVTPRGAKYATMSHANVTSLVRNVVAALSLLACTFSASLVSAQGDDEARRRFESGARAYAEGRYEPALEDFREAYRLSSRPELLNNIGETAERLHLDREALEAYERYLEAMHAAGHDVTNRTRVANRIRALRERLGEALAGEEHAATPPTGVDLALVGLGVTLAVVGVGAGGIGIAGLVLREDAAATYNGAGCDPTPEAPSSELRCGDVRSNGEVWATVGGVLLALGAATIAGGAALLLVGATSTSSSEVAVACTPSVGGLVCVGRF